MPDAAPEIVFTGAAKPPSWGERLIRAHTPEAHYQDLMKKYFWVTDRLEGPSLELALRLRPTVELAARAGGWSRTLMEGFYVGQAALFMAFLGYRGLKSAAGVFGGLASRHGSTMPELRPVALIEPPGGFPRRRRIIRGNWKTIHTPNVIALGPATIGVIASGSSRSVVAPLTEDDVDNHRKDGRKRNRSRARDRRNNDRRRNGILVMGEEENNHEEPEFPEVFHNDVRPVKTDKKPYDWAGLYDEAIGIEQNDAASKEAVIKLLGQMMMDDTGEGFRDSLASTLAEPNAAIRVKALDELITEGAEAFNVSDNEVIVRAQLLVQAATSLNTNSK